MNNTILETGNFKGVDFVIRKIGGYFVKAHYCAYIYAEKRLEEGDFLAGQEITFSAPASEVAWADSQLGQYVVGWDYGHCFNDHATLEEVRGDIKAFINEFLDGPEDSDDSDDEESLAELEAGLESEDTGRMEDNNMKKEIINIKKNKRTGGISAVLQVGDRHFWMDLSETALPPGAVECMAFYSDKKGKVLNWGEVFVSYPDEVSEDALRSCIKEFFDSYTPDDEEVEEDDE